MQSVFPIDKEAIITLIFGEYSGFVCSEKQTRALLVQIKKMNQGTKRFLLFLAISLSLAGIVTLLSSPAFLERRIIELEIDYEQVSTTTKTTTIRPGSEIESTRVGNRWRLIGVEFDI